MPQGTLTCRQARAWTLRSAERGRTKTSLLLLLAIVQVGGMASSVLANGGDTCATATVINALPYSDTGSTASPAVNDYDETCGGLSSGARDVVYEYTPPYHQSVTISLCGSSYDTFLYVYRTACPGVVVGCNDDNCALQSEIRSLALVGGMTYFLIVDGWSTANGNFSINVSADFLSDHPAGQVSNAFTTPASAATAELHAFALDPGAGSETITQVVFSLSSVVGLVDGDWSDIEIVVDANGDGAIGSGETTTVGGGGVVDQAAGTITFSTSFNVSSRTSYILRAGFGTLASKDSVTIDLAGADLAGGPGTGQAAPAAHTLIDLSAESVGDWKFNDNAGVDATDSSGNGRTGTLVNGPVWTGGIVAGGLGFDEINDHVLVTDFSYGPEFTWSLWFKTEDNTGSAFQYMLSHGTIGATNSVAVFLVEGASILRTAFLDTDDTADILTLDVSEDLVNSGWHHYALTVESGGGSKVYLDGVLRAADAARGGGSYDPATDIYLGGRHDLDADRFYGGRLDEVRLHDRALSLAEIAQLARGAGLKAHWKLDDGGGATAADSAGSSDGTLTDGPTWVAGRRCGGVAFDGTNDYINVPASAALNFTTDFTITGWFSPAANFNSSSATTRIVVEKFLSNDSNLLIALAGTDYNQADVAEGSLIFKVENGGGEFRYRWTNRTNWTAGTWYHFAAVADVRDSANNAVYINGADDTSATSAGTTSAIDISYDAAWGIGGDNADSGQLSGNRYFSGRIDDVRVYQRMLSSPEIRALAAVYDVIDLGSATGDPTLGLAINDAEQVAGFDENLATGDTSAWSSRLGLFTSIPKLSGGSVNEAHGINTAGNVVGWSEATGGIRKAFHWSSGGGTTDLGLLAGRTDSEALAVNDNDEVVGAAFNATIPPGNRRAFLYLPIAAYGLPMGMNDLGTLGGDQSVAMDINDSGRVVGGAQNAAGYYRPFRWDNGTMTDLGTLGGQHDRVDHRAQAVNGTGNIVGRSYTAGGEARAFFWDGSMTNLGVLDGGTESWALAINDSDDVVGTSDVTGGDFHAFLWDGTSMEDMNDIIDSGTEWTLIRATDINNDGEISGWGTNHRWETRAFMLAQTCASTPGGQSSGGPSRSVEEPVRVGDGSRPEDGSSSLQGKGTVDVFGRFEGEAGQADGLPPARVSIVHATPGATFSYRMAGATAQNRPLGPGSGNITDSYESPALPRTFTVVSSLPPGAFKATVSMEVSSDELADLGVRPSEMVLHVLDPAAGTSLGVWVPAGTNIGEAEPTAVLGDSGFVEYSDGSFDYWAVRDKLGTFAVGLAAQTDPDEPQPNPTPRRTGLCGIGLLLPLTIATVLLSVERQRRRRYR